MEFCSDEASRELAAYYQLTVSSLTKLCRVVSNRQICERIREPSRLDADCVSGEGLHFSFPETYCNIFHEAENTGELVLFTYATHTRT